jgi:small subunit ribosomal protein S5
MSEENKKPEENIVEEAKATEAKIEETPTENKVPKPYLEKAPSKPEAKDDSNAEGGRGQRRGPGGKKGGPGGPGGSHGGKRRSRAEQQEQPSEYIEKVVQVRRVTKVCKGGKKLSFRTTVIIGNEKGKVGVGVGKAAEVLIAIKKAIADARKQLVDISTVPNTNTISHTVTGVAGGSNVMLKPAADGTGIIAGGTARIVLELAGVGDILSKSKGSKSPLNVARATVNALKQLRSFQEVASLRGISVKKMLFV